MKTRFCVLGILLLVVAAVNAQQLPTNQTNSSSTLNPVSPVQKVLSVPQISCDTKNPLLPKLGQNEVKLFQNTIFDQRGLCHKEWTQHGTCCEQTTTETFVEKARAENRAALQDMQIEINMLDHNMYQLMETQLKGIKLPTDIYAASPLPPDQVVELLLKQRTLSALKLATHKLIALLTKWKVDMLDTNKRCMEKLNAVLAAGTCSICSGRSEQFFQGGRIKMTERYCRGILDECGASWYRMVSLVQIVRRVTAIIRAVSAETSISTQSKSYTKAISRFAYILKIKDTFESCDNFETCPFSKVSLLCESFITFVGDSYLKAVTSRSIPGLMGLHLSPSEEIKEINDQLDFLIHSAYVIFKKYTAKRKKKTKKFFRKVMNKRAILSYLRNIVKNLEKHRSRIMELTNNLTISIPTINLSMISTVERWIRRLKKKIDQEQLETKDKNSSFEGFLGRSERLRTKNRRIATRFTRFGRSYRYSSKTAKLVRSRRSGGSRKTSVPKQVWKLGNTSGRRAKHPKRHISNASTSVSAKKTVVDDVASQQYQNRRIKRRKSPEASPARIITSPPVEAPSASRHTATVPSQTLPVVQSRRYQAPAHSGRRGRKLMANLDICPYKQTMVVLACDLDKCLNPMMEP